MNSAIQYRGGRHAQSLTSSSSNNRALPPKQIGDLSATHLSHYDVIEAVAQSVAHQIPDRHGSVLQSLRLEANVIGPLDEQPPTFPRW